MPPPPTFDLTLTRTRMLAPNVRELSFARTDGVPFEFEAGQWVSLVLPMPTGEGRRAYSIASPPDGTPGLSIAVTKVEGGPGSTFLHELPVGGVLRAIGPQGFFTRARGLPSLFVGTGTGVTPLRSMILDAIAKGDDAKMTLVFGVRSPEDRLYADEFDALAARLPDQFQVHYSLSRAGADWPGRRGYVQTHVEELYRALPEGAHVYVCGLERMVGTVRDLLRKQLGVERKQVHTERYD
ncbi:MAG: FAD-dependent oxidoreductase [Labilithrix sp.]